MPQRSLFTAACLATLVCASPALARPADAPDKRNAAAAGEHKDMGRELADPKNQIAATVALTALAESLLNTRVEPVRRAMAAAGSDAAADLPPNARLRDMLGPGADKLPREIGRDVPRAMGEAASMADALQEMKPELKAALKRMKSALRQQ